MINYLEDGVFDKKVNKCLALDPFTQQNIISYNINSSNIKPGYLKTMKINYYTCSMECFNLFENLPIFTYHYELTCLCIKNCYDNIEINKL